MLTSRWRREHTTRTVSIGTTQTAGLDPAIVTDLLDEANEKRVRVRVNRDDCTLFEATLTGPHEQVGQVLAGAIERFMASRPADSTTTVRAL